MTLADLRRLAEQLPAGAALTLDRTTLLEVLATTIETTTHTVATLATQLHRSSSTVRGWLEAGLFPGAYQLPGAKRAGAWRIPQAAVDVFAARGVKTSRQDAPGRTIATLPKPRARATRAGPRADVRLDAWRKVRPKTERRN